MHENIVNLQAHLKSSKIVAMTIGEVARASGLLTSAIRYYEQVGLIAQPARAGGQRRYDRRVLERLAVVAFAKTCGFTLPEVRTLLTSVCRQRAARTAFASRR
jgi:DNA-binding transcriptional MerR regulator